MWGTGHGRRTGWRCLVLGRVKGEGRWWETTHGGLLSEGLHTWYLFADCKALLGLCRSWPCCLSLRGVGVHGGGLWMGSWAWSHLTSLLSSAWVCFLHNHQLSWSKLPLFFGRVWSTKISWGLWKICNWHKKGRTLTQTNIVFLPRRRRGSFYNDIKNSFP